MGRGGGGGGGRALGDLSDGGHDPVEAREIGGEALPVRVKQVGVVVGVAAEGQQERRLGGGLGEGLEEDGAVRARHGDDDVGGGDVVRRHRLRDVRVRRRLGGGAGGGGGLRGGCSGAEGLLGRLLWRQA